MCNKRIFRLVGQCVHSYLNEVTPWLLLTSWAFESGKVVAATETQRHDFCLFDLVKEKLFLKKTILQELQKHFTFITFLITIIIIIPSGALGVLESSVEKTFYKKVFSHLFP